MLKGDVRFVKYEGRKFTSNKKSNISIKTIGFDTEADRSGKCFMACTSLGDVWGAEQMPECFFVRKYQGAHFVSYNLKYDESAILQKLPLGILQELRENGKVEYEGFQYNYINYKFLSIRHNHTTVTFYDLYNFYGGSLNYNAEKYLDKKKIDIDPKLFTKTYIKKHWNEIALYCVEDAKLVQLLCERLIDTFEHYGVYPKKLYSTAYVSYQFFRENTNYVTVYDLWEKHKDVLDYATQSYNGGKFEVTTKGSGYFYEYDIVSAYPYEIANLVNITEGRIIWSNRYQKSAHYGFILCNMDIPGNVFSPIAYKIGELCTYPIGQFTKVITKSEYEYLKGLGCKLSIINACWIFCKNETKPYESLIKMLVKEKQKYKKDKASLEYHTVKIFLNSLYGKMVQLIPAKGYWKASSCWNPIYGSIITANTRIKVSAMQQKYDDVIAVHTDSIITLNPHNIPKTDVLGEFSFDSEGDGILLGCGVYQIGNTSKIRGFQTKIPMWYLFNTDKQTIKVDQVHVTSWREAAWRGYNTDRINKFETVPKDLKLDFDAKRIWLDEYKSFRDVQSRFIHSEPIDIDLLRLWKSRNR
jgi:hypothetical protein